MISGTFTVYARTFDEAFERANQMAAEVAGHTYTLDSMTATPFADGPACSIYEWVVCWSLPRK